jgi:asparagine synthetase B (glutamine-hydrolysing)
MRSAFGPSFPGVGTLEFYSMYHNPSIGIEEKAVRQLCIAGEDLLHDLLGLHYRRWGGLASDCELPKYSSTGSVVRQMMQTDYLMYLPGDILTKVDRATMSVSLEGREPLLDYRLAELAFAMPLAWKIDGNQRKKIFKEIAFSCIPRELLDRPKKGFSVPYYRWLKTDLKYLIDEHLSAKALRRHQILETKSVEGIVRRFLSDDRRVNVMTWNLLMFQMWCDRWM